MTKTEEPLAAILAEMRDERIIRLDGADVTRCLLRNLADRIEAAAERRVKEAKDGIWRNAEEIHDIHCNDCTFRAALLEILDIAATALHETKGE